MIARIRATGDIYNVIDMNDYRNRFQLENNNWYTMGEIELIEGNEPDYNQVRIQAAIEFAAQILANHGGTPASVAENAVDYADALVAELQKKGGQDETAK